MRFYLSLALAAVISLLLIGLVVHFTGLLASVLLWAIHSWHLIWSGALLLALLVGATLLLLASIALFCLLWRLLFLAFGGTTAIDPGALHASQRNGQQNNRVAAYRLRAAKEPHWANGPGKYRGTLRAFIEQHREFVAQKDAAHTTETELRIGIVLAGGGAKGVYQAGALRALWEFLEREKALEHVRAIAGTSIGSWNGAFWLSGKVASGELRDWWVNSRTSRVVAPAWYIPIVRNYFATTDPWRKEFRERFSNIQLRKFPYCYFTRTNVELPELEITTNRTPRPNRQDYRDLSNSDLQFTRTIPDSELEAAVFASMDLPPLFARIRDDQGQRYEDGGVIDNLPIRYTTWFEGCNLLFVFPLNATFQQRPSERSILKRVLRVTDIRQGALEHDALNQISIYNRVIRAAPMPAAQPHAIHTKTVTTFCICPDHPLAVDTVQFWKLPANAAACEELMYQATRKQLAMFDFSPNNQEVWMAKVSPSGGISYADFTA